ncbi:MAG: hypothetical protein M1383_04325 [Patescibacteria group bacterium]|nr:hypothetical protein [Patescibacteria group bacterium]
MKKQINGWHLKSAWAIIIIIVVAVAVCGLIFWVKFNMEEDFQLNSFKFGSHAQQNQNPQPDNPNEPDQVEILSE